VKTSISSLENDQEEFQKTWKDHYAVVRTSHEALLVIGAVGIDGRPTPLAQAPGAAKTIRRRRASQKS